MKKVVKYLIIFAIFLVLPFNVFAKEDKKVKLYLFHGDGCPHCADEIKYLEKIEDKYDYLEIVKYEVWYDDDNAELLNNVQDAFSVKSKGVPTNVIGNTVIVGFGSTTGSKIERAIQYYKDHEYEDVVTQIKDGSYDGGKIVDKFSIDEESSDDDMTISIPILGKRNLKNISLFTSAVVIGLIDGFNPCAMWILLFLISVLIGMKNRKRMWALGLTFLITSALVYMVIMLSWINIAIKVTAIIWIRDIIAFVAIIGGIVNLRSYIKSLQDSDGCDVVDEKKRSKIFSKIRKFTSEKSFVLALIGIVGLAVSVNLVELACSAGLPIVFTELLALNNVDSFMKLVYTFIYILFFLLDDLIVFFIAMFTMKVTGISTKYNKYSHLLGGIIMLLVGILLIFKPEWLMFNFR